MNNISFSEQIVLLKDRISKEEDISQTKIVLNADENITASVSEVIQKTIKDMENPDNLERTLSIYTELTVLHDLMKELKKHPRVLDSLSQSQNQTIETATKIDEMASNRLSSATSAETLNPQYLDDCCSRILTFLNKATLTRMAKCETEAKDHLLKIWVIPLISNKDIKSLSGLLRSWNEGTATLSSSEIMKLIYREVESSNDVNTLHQLRFIEETFNKYIDSLQPALLSKSNEFLKRLGTIHSTEEIDAYFKDYEQHLANLISFSKQPFEKLQNPNDNLQLGVCFGASLAYSLQRLGLLKTLVEDKGIQPNSLARYIQAGYVLFSANLFDKNKFEQIEKLTKKLAEIDLEMDIKPLSTSAWKETEKWEESSELRDMHLKITHKITDNLLNPNPDVEEKTKIDRLHDLQMSRDKIYKQLRKMYDQEWETIKKWLDPSMLNHFGVLLVPLLGTKEKNFADFIFSDLDQLIKQANTTNQTTDFILGIATEKKRDVVGWEPSILDIDDKINAIVGENAPLDVKQRAKHKLLEKRLSPHRKRKGHAVHLLIGPNHYELNDVNSPGFKGIQSNDPNIFKLQLLEWQSQYPKFKQIHALFEVRKK